MKEILFILQEAIFYSKYSPHPVLALDILISILIIFIFNFDIKKRVKCLLGCIFKKKDTVQTFCPLLKNVWDKVLKKNASQHFNYFLFVNFFSFWIFLSQENPKMPNIFTAMLISAILFTISYIVSEKKLIDYREDYLKRNIK